MLPKGPTEIAVVLLQLTVLQFLLQLQVAALLYCCSGVLDERISCLILLLVIYLLILFLNITQRQRHSLRK